MDRKRNRLEIIRDILKAVRDRNGRIKPTHVLYNSNLSHQMMNVYMKGLIENDMIKEVHTKNGRSYMITEKGQDYLNQYSLIANFTDSFGLN